MAHRLEKDVNRLVETIMEDYEHGRDIDVVENFVQPNKDDIVKIIAQIQNMIFPGYYKNKNYRIYTVRNNLSMQLEDVLYNLSKQISIVLKYLPEYEEKDEKDLLCEAEQLSLQFLDKITKRSIEDFNVNSYVITEKLPKQLQTHRLRAEYAQNMREELISLNREDPYKDLTQSMGHNRKSVLIYYGVKPK